MKKAIFNWSGGKDSSLTLYHVLNDKEFDVTALMTTVNSAFNRISMHGVRNELLFAQGKSIGLPIKEIRLPETPTMTEYDDIMHQTLSELKNEGVTHSIFGDIFLEDLRKYRIGRLKEAGLLGHFPLWKRDTKEVINEFIDLGFKAVVVCTKSELLDESFSGRVIDRDFINDLPTNVDPCGENGEFHTFVYDGPIFQYPIKFEIGERVFKEYKAPKDANHPKDNCFMDDAPKKPMGFHFCDLIPA